jgi:peptidoglycan/LPS O-acetylase OafA/YrhL
MELFTLLNPPKEVGRSYGIDFLRGVFSIYVLIFAHIAVWTVVAQGQDSVPPWLTWLSHSLILLFQSRAELNPAVLAFIVLSGFCIHRNGLRPGGALRSFAIRRAFRILPVFWLACVLGVSMFVASSYLSPEKAVKLTGTTGISSICFLAKASAIASLLPIAHPCDFLGNAPLLTVMVEIGLYAFYGIVFIKGGEKLVLSACGASLLCGVMIAAVSTKFPLLYNWWQNSSLLAFLPYWWIGAAVCVPGVRAWVLRHRLLLATVWLVLTVSTLWFDPTAISSELRKFVLATLMAWLILQLDATKMSQNPISLVGRAGYSIYAFHAPVATYLCILGSPWWLTLSSAIFFGLAAFYLFERPLDGWGQAFSRRGTGGLAASP